MGYVYDDKFFQYIDVGATKSAQVVVPKLRQFTGAASVLDVGCGQGADSNQPLHLQFKSAILGGGCRAGLFHYCHVPSSQ